jgi:hypothetical protein
MGRIDLELDRDICTLSHCDFASLAGIVPVKLKADALSIEQQVVGWVRKDLMASHRLAGANSMLVDILNCGIT